MIRQPFCEQCKSQGIITAAQCVHHIKPIESGKTPEQMETLAFSMGNLMSLCFDCHSEIHKAERSHSREAHQQRTRDRLEQWKARHTKQSEQ